MISKDRFKHYTIGVPTVDDGHWEIAQLMNLVILRLRQQDYSGAMETVNDLKTSVTEHIIDEEVLMVKINYPYRDYHILQHADVINTVASVYESIANRTTQTVHFLTDQSMLAFENSLLGHIDHYDSQFAKYVSTHAIDQTD